MSLQNISTLFFWSLFPFLTSILSFAQFCHTCLSSALILMLAVTIATTFRVLPNKTGVIPTRSAAGLERTTTKDHNVFLCVWWRPHHQLRGEIQGRERWERRAEMISPPMEAVNEPGTCLSPRGCGMSIMMTSTVCLCLHGIIFVLHIHLYPVFCCISLLTCWEDVN